MGPRALPAKPRERLTRPRQHTQISRPDHESRLIFAHSGGTFRPLPRSLSPSLVGTFPRVASRPFSRDDDARPRRRKAGPGCAMARVRTRKNRGPDHCRDPGPGSVWCQMMDSNQRRQCRRIYNPLPLAARAIWRALLNGANGMLPTTLSFIQIGRSGRDIFAPESDLGVFQISTGHAPQQAAASSRAQHSTGLSSRAELIPLPHYPTRSTV